MAVWGDVHGAVKLATVFPENPSHRGLPAIHAQILLFDALTGEPLALVDGTETTLRRTAAASALAARHLALPHAESLLVIGTGALAPHLIAAHTLVRPIRHVTIWGRSHAKAAALAEAVGAPRPDLVVEAAEDPAIAAARAQIISCATSAATPVLAGAWLSPGAHVDLVGGFSPHEREADDAVIRQARLFVDTRAGALSEAGDLLIPLASGVISPGAILGELSELCRGEVPGRTSAHDITVFKSVGAAIEDLIAAQLVLQHNSESLK
jgi:ornithine cyclodeaminase